MQNAIEVGDSEGLARYLKMASKSIHVGDLLEPFVTVKIEEVPKDTFDYMRRNPAQTAWNVVNSAVMICPGLAWAPAFRALGWSSTGVRAASFAARWQSTMGGYIAKRGVFASLTSAAMNGYGTAAANGVLRAGSLLTGIANNYFRPKAATPKTWISRWVYDKHKSGSRSWKDT